MKKRPDKGGDSDPEGLWRKVTRTVRAYAPHPPSAARPAKPSAPVRPVQKAMQKTAPPLFRTPPAKPVPAAMDPALARRLKRGREDIEGTLDLHGMTQAEACAALGRFISSKHRQDRRTLLVITGKGRAPGSGVLKRLLPLWLEELRDKVLSFSPAHARDGGEGAFYVRLRKKKES